MPHRHIVHALSNGELRLLIIYLRIILFYELVRRMFRLWIYPERRKFTVRLPKLRLHISISIDTRKSDAVPYHWIGTK